MKNFLAVVKSENKKITKYQDFDTKSEADSHVAKHGGFTVATPSNGDMEFWEVDDTSITHTSSAEDAEKIKRNALAEIHRLEGTITPRRLRDSVLTDEGKAWLADVEAKIATERGKL